MPARLAPARLARLPVDFHRLHLTVSCLGYAKRKCSLLALPISALLTPILVANGGNGFLGLCDQCVQGEPIDCEDVHSTIG